MRIWGFFAVILFIAAAAEGGGDANWWLYQLDVESVRSTYEFNQKLHLADLRAQALRGDPQALGELRLFSPNDYANIVAAIEAERKRQQEIDRRNNLVLNPFWRTNEHDLVSLVALKTKCLTELHRMERTKGDTNEIENIRRGTKSMDAQIAVLQQRKKAIEGK